MNHGKIFNSLNTDIVLSCARIKTTPPSTHKHTYTRSRAHTQWTPRASLSVCSSVSRSARVEKQHCWTWRSDV